jgi:hypothetical protein
MAPSSLASSGSGTGPTLSTWPMGRSVADPSILPPSPASGRAASYVPSRPVSPSALGWPSSSATRPPVSFVAVCARVVAPPRAIAARYYSTTSSTVRARRRGPPRLEGLGRCQRRNPGSGDLHA